MTESEKLFSRAIKIIPGGVNSPVRAFRHVNRSPLYFNKANGAWLFDVDGNSYVDFCLSFGPHILGHSHPAVVQAIRDQVELGTSYGANHPKELELAERILKGYPFLDQVRLVNSGTEAVMTASRIARGYTGRDKIVMFEGCYHGHSDGFLAKSGSGVAFLSESSSKGVPKGVIENTLVMRLDQPEILKTLFKQHDIAAVILELVPANNGLWIPKRELLAEIFRLAKENRALVIADEVITGFRLGYSGACGHYDLKPDIVTLGKIIGGGLPLAAIAGTREIMESLAPVGGVYQAGTLSGNPLAVAAGIAVLKELWENPPYVRLSEMTKTLCARLPGHTRQLGSLFWVSFGDDSVFPPAVTKPARAAYQEFFDNALKNGIYFAPSPYEVGFLSTAHDDRDVEKRTKTLCT